MSSPEPAVDKTKKAAEEFVPSKSAESKVAKSAPAEEAATQELLNEDGEVEVETDGSDADSAFGTDNSDSTSISSSIYAGYVENGRRYQTTREGEYWGPSDEKQFESMEAAHTVYYILESKRKNPLFRSPISDTAQNILDVGTGNGTWAREVADRYPSAVVHGVDLYPPPNTWVPPNCILEVDDVLKPWIDTQWRGMYKQTYENLEQGGWIEQTEAGSLVFSDDGSLKPDSLLAGWGPMFIDLCAAVGKKIDTIDTFKSRIEAAGFINVQEQFYKVPIGTWAKNPALKEAGKFFKAQVLEGLEGYALYMLTNHGKPQPWSPEEVQVYLAKVRNEINAPGLHAYSLKRRVWAQKPFDKEPKAESKVEVVNLA